VRKNAILDKEATMNTISGYSSSYNQYMSAEALQNKAFKSADSNSDGSISSDEFTSFIDSSAEAAGNDISSLFKSFDSNGDGTLSSDEMNSGMKSLYSQMESTMNQMRFGSSQTDTRSGASGKTHGHHHGGMKEMFSKADSSGDGSVDSTEFSDFLSQGPLANLVNAEDAFKKYDANNDGKLSSDEFKAGMKDLMASMPPPPPPSASNSKSSSSSSSSSSSTSSDSIISLLDSDGNGVIDSTELSSSLSNADVQKKLAAYLQQLGSSYQADSSNSLLTSVSA
jgi:Ca2+-binding EF-hand superfamily protein